MTFQLEVEYDYDFLILGISCHERDYRLCWLINRAMGYEMERSEDLEIHFAHDVVKFPVFQYEMPEEMTRLILIKNRVNGGILIPEVKQIDYLLKIENDHGEHEKLMQMIRKIPQVIGTFDLEVKNLKSKDHLIFE